MVDEKTLLVRGYEIKGKKDKVSLTLPNEIAKA
jgi:hypothetical protein